MLGTPLEANPSAPGLERVLRGRLEVLPYHSELAPRVELDDVSGEHAHVDDVADAAELAAAGFVGVSNVLERGGRKFTVRPEKINMLEAGDDPARGDTVESGRIRDVVYVGMFTRYVVELDSGGELTVVKQNLESSSQEALESRGKRVRLEWRPEHTFEIEGGGGQA